MDLANWALRTSPKFTTGVKYQFYKGFDQIRDPEILITLRPLDSLRKFDVFIDTPIYFSCRLNNLLGLHINLYFLNK